MKRQLLNFLAISTTAIISIINADNVLESPHITNFGYWGEWENCTDGFVVTGFQLKVEAYRRRPDNTALNTIKLFCGNIIYKSVQEISSTRGPFGRYSKPQYCSTYAKGFQLMSQSYQGRNRDDVAAVNFKLICADGEQLEGFKDVNGYEYRDSHYTEPQLCGSNQAICGIQTQVEYHQGLGDDTALNNVRVKCCDLPLGVVPIDTTTVQSEELSESTTLSANNEEIITPEQGEEEVQDTTTEIVLTSTNPSTEVVTDSSDDLSTTVSEVVPEENISTEAATTEIVTTEILPENTTDGLHEESTTEIVYEESTTEIVHEESTIAIVTTEIVHEVSNEEVTTEIVPEESTTNAATTEVTTEIHTEASTTDNLPEEVTTTLIPETTTEAFTTTESTHDEVNTEPITVAKNYRTPRFQRR